LVSVVVVLSLFLQQQKFVLESVQFWVTNRRENQKKEGKGKGNEKGMGREREEEGFSIVFWCFLSFLVFGSL
jgi:hypothetical protein